MTRRGRTLLLCVPLLAGCVYFNALYNARQRLADGERARQAGRADEARAAYDDAVRKAASSYRREPDGRWADDALYVLGRAYLRQGRLVEARDALAEAVRITDDDNVREGASLYLGAALSLTGEPGRGLRLLNEAIRDLPAGPLRAEGHYWRARLLLGQGMADQGWWDLDRAAEEDPSLGVPAHLERLQWGVLRDDPVRAAEGAAALLALPQGAARVDSLGALVRRAERRWGPGPAAELLAPARGGSWPPVPRGEVLFLRARLLAEAGDTLAAESEAGWVAGGVGDAAVDARLLLARIRIRRAVEVEDLGSARTVLLPAAGQAEVRALAEEIRTVELLCEWAVETPEAYFAAAELARDALGAPILARHLFLAYAEAAPRGPWTGKALLATLALQGPSDEDVAIRGRLARMPGDPYVRESRNGFSAAGGPSPLGRLERDLAARVEMLVERARAEARRRDVQLRGDTVPGRR